MEFGTLLRYFHVLAAIVFVGGILARQAVRSLASHADEIERFVILSESAGRIEAWMVIPGNLAAIVLGLAYGLRIDAPILGGLQGRSENWLLVANALLLAGLLVVPLYFLPSGKRFSAVLEAARREGRMTNDLRREIDNRVTRIVHALEILLVLTVIYLMVARPF
jgi:uncharacterized membrane protein